MESKVSRKTAANQLQGVAVQDQAVQSQSRREAAPRKRLTQETTAPATDDAAEAEIVVIRWGKRTFKGYLESPPWRSLKEATSGAPVTASDCLRIRHLDSSKVEEIPAGEIKAVFFVRSPEGGPDYHDIQFHDEAPVIPGIWMRVTFRDGEVIEGVADNSIRYLVDAGFFLRPTDTNSNNKLIYVMKSWIVDHHILGLTEF